MGRKLGQSLVEEVHSAEGLQLRRNSIKCQVVNAKLAAPRFK